VPSTYDVINPANESIVETVNLLGLEETDAVIAKAAKAFESWKNVAPGERARLLRAFSQVVTDHREELAQLEITNSGHTRGNALWEADNVANTLMYYAAAPERLFGRQIPVPGGIDVTFKEPLGVVGVIVFAAVGWVMFRYRDRGQAIPEQTHGKPVVEIVLTVIPVLILIGVAIPTASTIFKLAKTSDTEMTINVTGQQWWWEYDYPVQTEQGISQPIITQPNVPALLTILPADAYGAVILPFAST
jgi:hypothetical protein